MSTQGGAYRAFQHKSNVDALTSHQDNNGIPLPRVCPANGRQLNMVATKYPEVLRVGYGSAQRQQDNAQSGQHFQGLHHQQRSQATTASSGFHVSAQYSSHCETSVNENSVRQSVCNSGQQRECSNRNFLKGSNLNNNNRLHSNCAFSAGTRFVALKGDTFGDTAQTFPLEEASSSSVPADKQQTSSPLLHSLLKGNYPDFKYFMTNQFPSSEEADANTDLNTSTDFSDEMHSKSQRMKSSLDGLNCGQTRTQILDHSGIHSTPHQQQVTSPCLSGQLSTDKASLFGKRKPLTDDQIQDRLVKKFVSFIKILPQEREKYGHTHSSKGWSFCTNSTLQSDCSMPRSNSVAHLPTTPASDKGERQGCVERQSVSCPAAVGQEPQEDNPKENKASAELTPKSKTGDCTTVALEKHSARTPVSALENLKQAPRNECVENCVSLDFDFPVKIHLDIVMPTNGDDKLVHSDNCEDKIFVSSNDESFHSKWCDKYLQNGMTTLHYSLTALKELIASLEKVENIAQMDNFSKVILQQYWNADIDNVHLFASTEYPQIMAKVAAICTKNEDESPVVLNAVSGMTLDELTEKHPSLRPNCSLSQEEYKSWAVKQLTEKEKGDTGLKPVEAVGLDNVQGVTTVSEDLQTKSSSVVTGNKTFALTSLSEKKKKNMDEHCHITCQEVIEHSKLNSSNDQIQIHNVISVPTNQREQLQNQSREGVMEDAGSVHSQTELSLALSENKVQQPSVLPESEDEEEHSHTILKVPQYEDISDDEDKPQFLTNLPNTEHEELSFPPCIEELQYEDISNDENPQIETSLTQVFESNNKQPPFENEDCDHIQDQAQNFSDEKLTPKKQVLAKTGTLDIAQDFACPCFGETDDFEHLLPEYDSERHLERQTNLSSDSPSSVFKDGDETDDQLDDDWIVIPMNMTDLTFETEDEHQDVRENNVLDDGETGDKERQGDTNPTHSEFHCPAPNPVPASLSSHIEVFDTVESFLQAKAGRSFEVVSGKNTPEHDKDCEPHTPQNRRESYSDPEDSCETEDSCDYSSASEHNYLTVSRELLKERSVSQTNDSVSEKDCEHDEATNVQEGQTKSLDKLSHMQKLRQLIEAKVDSKRGQPKTNKQNTSKKENEDIIIIHDSDTEDESDQKCKKKSKRKAFSSHSVNCRDASWDQQRGHPPETVDSQCGTLKQKFKKNRWPSEGSPAPQCQSKLHETHVKELIQDSCSDLTVRIKKSRQLIESGSEHFQQKKSRQTTSKRRFVPQDSDKVVKERTRSSVSKDSGSALFAIQNKTSTETVNSLCGTAEGEPQKTALEDSPERRPRSVDKEAESTLGPNPVIPRLFVKKSSQPSDYFKFLKESEVHSQGKNEALAPKTPKATSKKANSCDKKTLHLHRDEQGRFVSKPEPANDRLSATKKKVQASVTKPKLVARQLSLPSQEGPSISTSSLTSTSGQLSEARQSSTSSRGLSESGNTTAFSGLSKTMQCTPVPRQRLSSSKLKRSHSYSNPSTSDHPHTPTKVPSPRTTMQPSATKRVTNDWQKSYFPTRWDRKMGMDIGIEEALRTTNYVSKREAMPESRPGPSHYDRAPRRRHDSHESETPLMKRSKFEAIQRTKARNQNTPTEQRYCVGVGYKWSEKPTAKGSKKYRPPRRPHQ